MIAYLLRSLTQAAVVMLAACGGGELPSARAETSDALLTARADQWWPLEEGNAWRFRSADGRDYAISVAQARVHVVAGRVDVDRHQP